MINILNVYLDDFIPQWHNRLDYVQYHVFVLVTEGHLTYHLNTVKHQASKGDLVFIPSGTQREAHNDDVLHQKYAVTFTCSAMLDLPLLHRRDPYFLQTNAFDRFKERFVSLHQLSLEQKPYYQTIQAGILLEMLGITSRELESPPLPRRKLQYADQLEQHILHNYRKIVPLRELADLIQRSPNYTLTLFKEVVGLTPLEYQHRLRITSAMEMLENTRFTVTFIAEHLGYYDTSSFYKIFRKYTGLSPTAYANRSLR